MGGDRRFTDAIYDQFARVGRTVASPKRIELLDLLCQGPRSVESLAAMTGLSEANASQHLKVLRSARLVEAEKSGVRVIYRLSGKEVADFIRSLRIVAETRLAEVEQTVRTLFKGRQEFEAVDREELLRRVRDGEVTVLDVRPAEEFHSGHLPSCNFNTFARVGLPAGGTAQGSRDRGLLSWSVLRHGTGCGRAVAGAWLPRRAPGHRCGGLAGTRAPGRDGEPPTDSTSKKEAVA